MSTSTATSTPGTPEKAPVASLQAYSCNSYLKNSAYIPPQTPPARAKDLSKKYQKFVKKLVPNFFRHRPFENFLSWDSSIGAKIHLVTFRKDHDLASCLERCNERQLYIIENVSPQAAKLLGGYLDINPQLFADYPDMVPESESNPSTMKCPKRGTGNKNPVPSPLCRWGDIDYHLPPLRSVEHSKNHVPPRFIGPREYRSPEGSQPRLATLEDRLMVDSSRANVERVAGGHNPVQLENRTVWPVAMTRHSVAAWFNKGESGSPGDWLKGVILLDQPFESTQKSLTRLNSRYRPFSKIRSMHYESAQNTELRETYLTSLLHCFDANEELRQEILSPAAIFQDVYRIVVSEWIAVNTYLERDLNAIDWQLEENNKTPTLDVLEQILTRLFIMRRRNRKYKAFIGDQLQLRFPNH
ncbi:hypothetical protein K458DRAFT_387852 [Lentithecium fluviatile CBS 122367]|uniref:Uncharacterized protein n=1 Tax=Lentithecium fluviatile CBS 122367 TaxID=1168545 RepID=A0A6G1J655_9PLEO|nr:hypothetical protein K458DRAFT_387852 [Lentithecium fluviatile CBS 122367]